MAKLDQEFRFSPITQKLMSAEKIELQVWIQQVKIHVLKKGVTFEIGLK